MPKNQSKTACDDMLDLYPRQIGLTWLNIDFLDNNYTFSGHLFSHGYYDGKG